MWKGKGVGKSEGVGREEGEGKKERERECVFSSKLSAEQCA